MKLNNKIKQLKLVIQDQRWWSFYGQRFVLNLRVREALSTLIAKSRPQANFDVGDDTRSDAEKLKNSGLVELGQVLDAAQCAEIRRYFSQKLVTDPYRPNDPAYLPDSGLRNPASHIAHHTPSDVVNAPHLIAIANHPKILALAANALGCKPTIGYLAAWWSYATGQGAQQAENFHRDVDDWRFFKLFLYLTDVGADNGPHIYVASTANDPRLTEIRRFEDVEVIETFGSERLLQMCAPAGSAFLENTFGIHKGQPVKQGVRLIFQAVYCMTSLPYGPKKPCGRLENFPQLDVWVNRNYLA